MRTDIDVLLGRQLNTISEADSRRASDEAARTLLALRDRASRR